MMLTRQVADGNNHAEVEWLFFNTTQSLNIHHQFKSLKEKSLVKRYLTSKKTADKQDPSIKRYTGLKK